MLISYVNVSMQKVRWYVDGNLSSDQFDRQMRKIIESAIDEYHKNVKNRKDRPVRNVYEVVVVMQDGAIEEKKVIATTEENAQFEVLRELLEEDQTPDDVDVFVGKIGALKDRES